jgi:hypothetical protein
MTRKSLHGFQISASSGLVWVSFRNASFTLDGPRQADFIGGLRDAKAAIDGGRSERWGNGAVIFQPEDDNRVNVLGSLSLDHRQVDEIIEAVITVGKIAQKDRIQSLRKNVESAKAALAREVGI